MGLELISVNTKDMFKPLITVCAFCSTQLFIFGSQNGGGGRKMGLKNHEARGCLPSPY